MGKNFDEIIESICKEENIKFKRLSKGYVYMLEKDNVIRFISGHKFDLNSHAMGLICDDKYALYDVLKANNIPVIEHKIVYKVSNTEEYAIGCNTPEYVHDYFKENNNNLVLKPNDGTCGQGVYNVVDENDLDDVLRKLFRSNFSISMCPFYESENEYRVIMLDHECEIIYAKYLPIVVGNGVKTIRELLREFNEPYFKDKLEDSEYDRVLEAGEIYKYGWKFNLSQGSIAKYIDNEKLKEDLISLAKRVADLINLEFGSVDIINYKGELMVLEVNSGVMSENYINLFEDGYNVAKEMYRKAILKMFK